MPLVGDFAGLTRLKEAVRELGQPDAPTQLDIGRSVGKRLMPELKAMFAVSAGPEGPWKPTVRGKPALRSKKLPQEFEYEPVTGGVSFANRINWLEAHDRGHVFPVRKAGGQVLSYNLKGRLVRKSRIKRLKFVEEKAARRHLVGIRILPARPMIPRSRVPVKWEPAINLGAGEAMARWYARAGGGK